MAKPKRARPFITYVLALAAAMTLPPLVLAGLTTFRWVASERARLGDATQEMTDRVISQVDRYLSGRIAMLQALGTSPAIDAADLATLDRQARELLDLQGLTIVLRSPTGQQLVNTRVPLGETLPKGTLSEADREMIRTGAPVISNLYPGILARAPLVRVTIPVTRGGELRYILTASLSPKALSGMIGMAGAGIGRPYSASIADREGRILARSTYDPEMIGLPLPGFAKAVGPSGSWSGVNPAGTEVYAAFRRSKLSGWLVAVGVDKAVVDAPLYRSMIGLGLLAAALAAAALALSSIIIRRVAGSHRQLVEAADALGLGELVEAPETPVREANQVGLALADASVRLRDQAADLVAANRDLEERVAERTRKVSEQARLIEATLDNMDQGLMLIAPDRTVPICNQRAMDLLDLPEPLMRSRPSFEAVLRHQLAANDFARSGELLRRWVEGGGVERTNHTYERERPDGTVLEIRTVPLGDGGAVRTYTDVTARKASERLSGHMARHDALTGLPNRLLLRERLAAALAEGSPPEEQAAREPVAVLCIDLDRFKLINDTLGHPAGDALLRVAAERIGGVLAPGDLLARLGGDEFAIIQTSGAQPEASERLSGRIVDALRAPFVIEGRVVNVGASIGIAVADEGRRDADHLFKCADLALYAAKNGGRNGFRVFEPAMEAAVQARQALEIDLRLALARGEFELHYQPVVRLADESVVGFEALLRWNHPERGMLLPGEFVPLLEDTGLIVPVGTWVLREACRTAVAWPSGVRVLVNLSARQIEDQGLPAAVLGALAAGGLPPGRLQLELTESALIRDCEASGDVLQALRQSGVTIALDDFGTGYSSLGYLQHLALDAIKIDRSFVADRGNGVGNGTAAAVLSAVVGLGRALGLSVTAEGVETPEQLAVVQAAGCHEAQGFLFGRPVEAAAALALVAGERRVAEPADRAAA